MGFGRWARLLSFHQIEFESPVEIGVILSFSALWSGFCSMDIMRQIPFSRKVSTAIFLVIGMAGLVHAQSIDQQVIGSSGREVKQGSIQLSFTVGEVAVADANSDTLYLTQGYQQAFLDESSPIRVDDLLFDLVVFPNPFSDVVTLRSAGQTPAEPIRLTWTDISGRVMLEQVVQLLSGTDHQLDLRSLPAGSYQVTMSTSGQPYLATFQLIHIQH